MKGLLIKDFKLMKEQKNFLLIILIITIGMSLFTDDLSFALGFLTFIVSLFSLSTISYDEFDNGNAFLFTLPITRSKYVIEKYYLSMILGIGSWILSICIISIVNIFRNLLPFSDVLMTALFILPFMLLIQAIMIPFQLKFGGEKGRIAIIASIGALLLSGIVLVKIASFFNIDIIFILNHLPVVSMGMLVSILIIATGMLWFISLKISMSIMNKKEF